MDIPEDVMKAAKSHAYAVYSMDGEEAEFLGVDITSADGVRVVARAILAERERCAKVCEHQAHAFLSPEYTADQPLGSFEERFACASCADAIRAAPQLAERVTE